MQKAQSMAEMLAGEVLDHATYRNTELWDQYPELHDLSYTVAKGGQAEAELTRRYGTWGAAVKDARSHGVQLRREAGYRDGNPVEQYESIVNDTRSVGGVKDGAAAAGLGQLSRDPHRRRCRAGRRKGLAGHGPAERAHEGGEHTAAARDAGHGGAAVVEQNGFSAVRQHVDGAGNGHHGPGLHCQRSGRSHGAGEGLLRDLVGVAHVHAAARRPTRCPG